MMCVQIKSIYSEDIQENMIPKSGNQEILREILKFFKF